MNTVRAGNTPTAAANAEAGRKAAADKAAADKAAADKARACTNRGSRKAGLGQGRNKGLADGTAEVGSAAARADNTADSGKSGRAAAAV